MSDIKLFRLADNAVIELEGRSLALEKSLQTLMERNLETLLGVRFLVSEYATGQRHKGRIDTLGLDENGCPVIIEYKRATNEVVINQGLFYLDWLMDHQAEFKLLVMERLGKELAEEIEWASPRLVCIAGDFTRYDEHAVQQINRNIELIRYRHYPEGYLVLEMVNAVSAAPTPKRAVAADSAACVMEHNGQPATEGGRAYKTVTAYLEQAPADVQDLYQSLEDFLLSLGDDVTRKTLKHYIAFKRMKNFATVEVKPHYVRGLTVLVKCQVAPEMLIEGFTRDVRDIGHLGTGNLEITIRTRDALERAKQFIEQSYQGN